MRWQLRTWVKNRVKAKIRTVLTWLLYRKYSVAGSNESRLKIADTAVLANTFFTLNSGSFTVEDYVLFGYNVCVFTGTHDYTKSDDARIWSIPTEGRDVLIKHGAWIGSNATILGPAWLANTPLLPLALW